MSFAAVVLWIHVTCGVLWIAASAAMVVAAAALAQEPAELTAVLSRGASTVNLLGVGCAGLMPLTGLLNLFAVARTDPHALNAEFLAILAAKAGLFTIMAWALWRAIGVARLLRDGDAGDRASRIVRAYGVVAGAGALALLCGVWLAGMR